MEVANLASSEYAYIYSGKSFELSDLDEPGIILTNLQRENFSHVETFGRTSEVVVMVSGEETRMVFLNSCIDNFRVQLADQSFLDITQLDEHIHVAV